MTTSTKCDVCRVRFGLLVGAQNWRGLDVGIMGRACSPKCHGLLVLTQCNNEPESELEIEARKNSRRIVWLRRQEARKELANGGL